MGYTIIRNRQGGGPRCGSKMLSINKTTIVFTSRFRDKYSIGDNVVFYVNDDKYLCFKFVENRIADSFCVTHNDKAGHFLRNPQTLREIAPIGKYTVVEKDGYFFTDCKLNLE